MIKDLTGQVFNYLTVLEYRGTNKGNSYWLCQCVCGVRKTIRRDKITQNWVVSCGCKYAAIKLKQEFNRQETIKQRKCAKFMYSQLRRILYQRYTTRTQEVLGYTNNQLAERLESLFTSEMTWSNYGTYWHIDHIIPVSYFTKNGIFDPKIINALINLQPLTATDNIKKGGKVEW